MLQFSSQWDKVCCKLTLIEFCFNVLGVSGKYIKDNNEATSSEETRDEEKQKKLFEVSGGYVRLDGYEVIEVPEPPKEEEKKKEEKKEEAAEAKPEGEEGEKKEEEEEKKDEEKKGKICL